MFYSTLVTSGKRRKVCFVQRIQAKVTINRQKNRSKLANGDVQIVFDPEANKEGRELMISRVFQRNVSACLADKAHELKIIW